MDIDSEIEAKQKKSIREIFEERGEAAFRDIETETLRDHVTRVEAGSPCVFALGGGAGSTGVSLASAMVLVIPVVVAYAFLQRNFIESMAGAGIKG